jgi:hypothetical protein
MTMTGIAEIFIARLVVSPAGATPESIKNPRQNIGIKASDISPRQRHVKSGDMDM